MSMAYNSADTGEWVCTCWAGGEGRGGCVDFGANRDRAEQVLKAAGEGARFTDETGWTYSGFEFAAMVFGREFTFGEFGGTFEVGSGDMATYEGF